MKQDIEKIRKQVKLFEEEVFAQKDSSGVMGIVVDQKDDDYRVVLFAKEASDIPAIEKLAAHYFEGIPYKIISKGRNPKVTSTIFSGSGIRNVNSGNFGTLGGFFTASDGITYGVTNAHVVASPVKFTPQQGDECLDENNELVGHLQSWYPLQPYPQLNYMDAALIKLADEHQIEWVPDTPAGELQSPMNQMHVYKQGSNTGYREGQIINVDNIGSFDVEVDNVFYKFTGIITIKGFGRNHFSAKRDSGSFVISKDTNKIVAIIFAKYHEYSFALPMHNITQLLGF